MRASPLPDNMKPVGPGMIGGKYQPLSSDDVIAVEETIYQLLEEIGLSQAPPSGVEAMIKVGAILGEDNRLRFPRTLVKEMLSKSSRNITLFAQDPSMIFN